MKIRTDFVTNSSSASFIVYTIKSGNDKEKFEQFKKFISDMQSKYIENCICAGGGDGIFVKENEITITAITEFEEYAPPETAIAGYLCIDSDKFCDFWLESDNNISLLDENGNINKNVPTDMSTDEAKKLCEFLESMEIEKGFTELFTD